MKLILLEGEFDICRLDPGESIPPWAAKGSFFSITRTREELSIVVEHGAAPDDMRAESGWRLFALEGPIPFTATGVLTSVAGPLAAAHLPIFAVSTFDTDYILVKSSDVERAGDAWRAAGFGVAACYNGSVKPG